MALGLTLSLDAPRHFDEPTRAVSWVVEVLLVHGGVVLVRQELHYQVLLPAYVTKVGLLDGVLVASVAEISTLGDLELLNEILAVDDLREVIVDVVEGSRDNEPLR